jgi:hypothetical protein
MRRMLRWLEMGGNVNKMIRIGTALLFSAVCAWQARAADGYVHQEDSYRWGTNDELKGIESTHPSAAPRGALDAGAPARDATTAPADRTDRADLFTDRTPRPEKYDPAPVREIAPIRYSAAPGVSSSAVAAPELEVGAAAGGLTLLIASLLVLRAFARSKPISSRDRRE